MSEREQDPGMAAGAGRYGSPPAGDLPPEAAVAEGDEPRAPEPDVAELGAREPQAPNAEVPEPVIASPVPGARPVDLVLARLHLRLGLLGLARAELETLAGTAELDLRGILDLAEVRWRTGDLRGAGEAAAAYLALAARAGHEPDGPVAHAIVAEAAAVRGHDAEAAEAVAGALAILRAGLDDDAALEPALDRLFAGIAPRGPWPEPEQARVAPATSPRRLPWELFPGAAADDVPSPGAGSAEGQGQSGPSPAQELLEAGRDALAADEPGRAAVALGLALRSEPGSGPAIVAAVEEAGTLAAAAATGGGAGESSGRAGPAPDPGLASLAVVHGDALRAAGHDDEAVVAYDLARQLAARGDETAPAPAPAPATAPDEIVQAAVDDAGDLPPPGGSP